MRLLTALLCALAVGAPQQEPPDEPVLTIDDEAVGRQRYVAWLLLTRGELLLGDFGRARVILRAAQELGMRPAADPRAAAEMELLQRARDAFGGDRDTVVAELEKEGRSWNGRVVERSLELEVELLLDTFVREIGAEGAATLEREAAEAPTRAVAALHDARALCDPATVVATVAGAEVSAGEYGTWLLAYRGELYARRFAEELVIERAARTADVAVAPEAVETRVAAELERRMTLEFGGDRERWLADLARRGRTEASQRREAERRARLELQVEGLFLRDRTVSEEELSSAWEREYGPGGRRLELRWIRLDDELPAPDPELSDEEARRLAGSAREATDARARALLERLEEGEDFATLAERYSADPRTRDRGGRPAPGPNAPEPPAAVRAAVSGRERGALVGPVRQAAAVYLVEVLEARTVPLEDVREELHARLAARRPSAVELAVARNELLREVKIRVLPAMFR